MYPSFKMYLHTVSAAECFAASECHWISFTILYIYKVNPFKSQVHKQCLSIKLSLQLTFHKLRLSFLLLVSFICSTEYHLSEVKSSDIHFL